MKPPHESERLYDVSERAKKAGCKCEVFLAHRVFWWCHGFNEQIIVSAFGDMFARESAILVAVSAAYGRSGINKPKAVQAEVFGKVLWLKVYKVVGEKLRDRLLVYFSADPAARRKRVRRVAQSATTPATISNAFHDVTAQAKKAGLSCDVSFSECLRSWLDDPNSDVRARRPSRLTAIFSAVNFAFWRSGLKKPELICAEAFWDDVFWIQAVRQTSGPENDRLLIFFPNEARYRLFGVQP